MDFFKYGRGCIKKIYKNLKHAAGLFAYTLIEIEKEFKKASSFY